MAPLLPAGFAAGTVSQTYRDRVMKEVVVRIFRHKLLCSSVTEDESSSNVWR